MTGPVIGGDPNKHVREYLDYYLNMKQPPHYAVLLSGAWGIGKSTLIRNYLYARFPPPIDESEAVEHPAARYIYVSLFGIQTVEQLQTAILHKAYPIIANRAVRVLAGITKAAAKKWAVAPDLSAVALLGEPNAELFVFDDLERSELSASVALGYINRYVEHLGRKVIIVANDEAIKDTGYHDQLEKVVGQTLKLRPVLTEALDSFIATIEDADARAFLGKKSDEIVGIFGQSGSHNLRHLQQSIWVFVRLYACVTPTHRKHDGAMIVLLRLLLALCLEWRMKKLDADALANRKPRLIRAVELHLSKKPTKTGEERANCYPEVDFGDVILSTEVLIDILDHGLFEPEKIRTCLDESIYFLKADEEDAWRTVWFGFERDETVFSAAVSKLAQQFADREFTIPGLILQVFGIRIWLSKIRVLEKNEDTVVNECLAYLDALFAEGRLDPLPFSGMRDDPLMGYAGLAFREAGSTLTTLHQRMRALREEAQRAKFPEIGQQLVELMRSDTELFFRRLCTTNSDDNLYTHVPVLAHIDANHFVETLLERSPPDQGRIMNVFASRYEFGDLERNLAPEKAWLVAVKERLESIVPSLSAIGRARVAWLLESNMPQSILGTEVVDGETET